MSESASNVISLRTPPRKTIDKLMLLHKALADPELNKADVKVLAVLIEATNRYKGYAWASMGTIAETAGVTKRYVQGIVRKLESRGYVEVEAGGHGPRSTNRYFVNFEGLPERSSLAIPARNDKGAANASFAPERVQPDDKGEQIAHKGEQPVPKGRTPGSSNTSYDPSYTEPFRTHGVTLKRDALSYEGEQKIAQSLKFIESGLRNRDLTEEEAEWLENIVDIYDAHSGDPLGGWAYRLLAG